jgi:hypothetical protein
MNKKIEKILVQRFLQLAGHAETYERAGFDVAAEEFRIRYRNVLRQLAALYRDEAEVGR